MLHRRPMSSTGIRLDKQGTYHMASTNSTKRKPVGSYNAYFKKRSFKIIRLLLLILGICAMQQTAFFPIKDSSPPTQHANAADNLFSHNEELISTDTQGIDGHSAISLTRVNGERDKEVLEIQVDENDEILAKPSEKDADSRSAYSSTRTDTNDKTIEAKDFREVKSDKEEKVEYGGNEDANESKRKPWAPPPDDGLDLDNLPPHTTGAFANCTNASLTTAPPHHDQKNITLSCHTLPYRIPQIVSSEKIFIGVLSEAGGDGPDRRQSIRDTWATNHSVYFLVAGPWKNVEKEYNENQDLIWLDEDEIYDGERSVLTYKTMALMKIVHHLSTSQNLEIKYAFKTDDDSFINVSYLHKYLLETNHDEEFDYWGWCQRKMFMPLRGSNDKWAVSNKTYPEPRYPRYCQGAGFALSWKFLSCAAGPGNHIANSRFMPFEDVATGLIAQRCGIVPTMVEDPRLIHMYRTDRTEERERVNQGLPKISKKKLPIPDMEGRIVQHRIYDAWDMKEHYKQVFDPEGYKKNSDFEWYYREEEEE